MCTASDPWIFGQDTRFHDLEVNFSAHPMRIKSCLAALQGPKLMLLIISNACKLELPNSYILSRENLLGNLPTLVADESFPMGTDHSDSRNSTDRVITFTLSRSQASNMNAAIPENNGHTNYPTQHNNGKRIHKAFNGSDPGQLPPSDQDTNTKTSSSKKIHNFALAIAFLTPTIAVSRITFLLTLFFELMSRKRDIFVHMYLLILPVTFTIQIFETLAFWCKVILYYIPVLFLNPSAFNLTTVSDLICHVLSFAALFSLKSGLPMSFSLIHIPVICGLSILYANYSPMVDVLFLGYFLKYIYFFAFLVSLFSIYFGVIGTKSKYNDQTEKNFVDWYRNYKSENDKDLSAYHHNTRNT